MRRQVELADGDFLEVPVEVYEPPPRRDPPGPMAPPSITVEDLRSAHLQTTEWCIEQILERGQVVLLVATAKSGKSTLLQHVGVCAALGQPIGGLLEVCGPHLVVFVDQENPRGSALRRLRSLGGEEAIASGRLHFLHRPGVRFDEPGGVTPLRAKLEELRAERSLADLPLLIVVDSWAKTAAEIDENDNGSRLQRISRLIEFAHEHGATVVVAANPSRGDAKRVRGGVSLEDQIDGLLAITRHDDGRRTLSLELIRGDFEPPPEMEVLRTQDEPDGPIEITLEHVHHEPEPLDSTDVRILRALLQPGIDAPKAVAEFLKIPRSTVAKRGRKLVDHGLIRRERRTWTPTNAGESTAKMPRNHLAGSTRSEGGR